MRMSPGNGWISDVMYLMANGVELLEREVYTEAEASRLLRTPQSTLHYWLEGGRRGYLDGRGFRFGPEAGQRGGHRRHGLPAAAL